MYIVLFFLLDIEFLVHEEKTDKCFFSKLMRSEKKQFILLNGIFWSTKSAGTMVSGVAACTWLRGGRDVLSDEHFPLSFCTCGRSGRPVGTDAGCRCLPRLSLHRHAWMWGKVLSLSSLKVRPFLLCSVPLWIWIYVVPSLWMYGLTEEAAWLFDSHWRSLDLRDRGGIKYEWGRVPSSGVLVPGSAQDSLGAEMLKHLNRQFLHIHPQTEQLRIYSIYWVFKKFFI